ncbi:hypothetical protein [[Mycoplasma] imitans]|uniref:hypothetical protein n=1 Tax=[Mycoplasma] imitans TaxID=29560 RepID=UPI00047FBC8F|nr:hypothetical protein [[Mycoplasma] imitans]
MILKQFATTKITHIIKIILSLILALFLLLGLYRSIDHHNPANNQSTSLTNQAQLVADNNNDYQQLKTNNNHYVTNSKNDYFVLTKTGVVKMDVFGNVYYNYNFANTFINYQTVDFVADTLRQDFYYLLIKNPIVNISGTSLTTLTVSSPAYVLQLKDENNTLNIVKTYQLSTYRFSRDIATLYSRIGFEQNQTNNTLLGLLDKPSNSSLLNNITYFYYNSISRLVFINNRLGVFGNNENLSLWFYLFDINQANDFNLNNELNLVTIFPQLYGLTDLNWSINNLNNANHAASAQFVINNIRLYSPAYFVAGVNVVKQNLVNNEGLLSSQQTATYSLHLGLIPVPISRITNNNQFGYKVSSNFYNSDNPNYSNLFVSGVISQTKVAQITNNINIISQFFSASNTIRLDTTRINANSQFAYHYSVLEDNSNHVVNNYPNLVGILIIKSEIIGFVFAPDSYNLISQRVYPLIRDDVQMSGFDLLTGIQIRDSKWWLSFFDPKQSISWINQINPSISQINNGALAINYTKIYQSNKQGLIFLNLVLSDQAFYSFISNSSSIKLNLIYRDRLTNQFKEASFFENGIPSFDNIPNSNGTKLWGIIKFKPDSYLVDRNLNTMSANSLSNNNLLLKKLYEYTPGEIDWSPRVIAQALDNQTLRLKVQFPYFDGNYYSADQRLINLAFPSITYDKLDAYPVYFLPTVVISAVVILILIILFIFLIVVQILKTKKVSLDLFRNANRKVDKLNDSVNIIYQKIETQLYSPHSDHKRMGNKLPNNQTVRINQPPNTPFANPTMRIQPTTSFGQANGFNNTQRYYGPYVNPARFRGQNPTGFVSKNPRPPFNDSRNANTRGGYSSNQTRTTPTQQFGFPDSNK